MLSVQRPEHRTDPTLPPLPEARMNPAIAVALALVALVGIVAGIMVYQARQVPEPAVSSACTGGLSAAQERAIRQAGVQLDYTRPIPRNVPLSGDAALQTSRASVGPGGAAARCLVESLVDVYSTDPNLLVIPAFHETPFQGPAWMVILQGVGQVPATPTVPSMSPEPPVSPEPQTAGASAPRSRTDAFDLVSFVDPYSGILVGSLNIPQSTER